MEIILSSCKRGYGLKELVSAVENEYWNTDDALPHSMHITFPELTYVHSVVLSLSYSLDESYTPERIAVHFAGKQRDFTFSEPEGRCSLSIDAMIYDVHIIIINNHSDGKDSHVRKLRVMTSPSEEIKLF